MSARVLERLDQPGGGYYTNAEALSAINEAMRFFALLTLGLEKTVTFNTGSSAPFFHMQSFFGDWLLPLRMTTSTGKQVRPARLSDLDCLDANWQNSTGTDALRYVALGLDFVVIYPASQNLPTTITYARAPVPLVGAFDVPEFPEQTHPAFVDYGTYRLRFREGGQEFAKALPYFQRYLDEAQRYARLIRARNIGSRYDKLPFELERADLSKLLSLRPGLVPARKVST